MKLPKQWLHWAQKAGLSPERKRGRGNKFYTDLDLDTLKLNPILVPAIANTEQARRQGASKLGMKR